jgi:hypothetical protein
MRTALGVALVVGAALSTTACNPFSSVAATSYKAANPAPVSLSADIASPIRIGLIVSANSPEGEGRDVAPLAQGARVAALRFNQHGTKVVLEVKDDGGTAQGAKDAVAALSALGVSGIVYASEGEHLAAGLAAAHAASLPVLLPYAGSLPAGATQGVWLTGPSTQQVAAALQARVATEKLGSPYAVSLGVAPPVVVQGVLGTGRKNLPLTSVSVLTKESLPPGTRAVLAWASADASARIVEQLQSVQVNLPVILSPSVLSSAFVGKLADDAHQKGTATASGRYVTAGLPTSLDTPTAAGFAAALRLTASDLEQTSVLSSASFADEGLDTADARSHDAVVALVVAASRSPKPEGQAVAATLAGLTLTTAQGLVGPPLAFATPDALSSKDVSALQSSVSPDGQHLVWFALPAASGTP